MKFFLLVFIVVIHTIETTTNDVSICSSSLLVTSIDPSTGNEFVRPCPAPSPCQCLCQIESQRLWIDCFHRQLTTLPSLTAVPSTSPWNIDLSFNRFENLSADQRWIPEHLRLQSVILSGDLAYDLIVQLNLNYRHLVERWEDHSHLVDDHDALPGSTRRFLTEFTSKLRGQSQSIRSFDLSLAGEDPFPSISILYLDHNRLDAVPLFALYNATMLEELYLSSNRLTSVPAFAFGFSHRLTRLDLSNNRISSLDPRTFDRHPEAFAGPFLIDYLDLSSNLLVHLHPSVFSYLVNLRLLKLQNNRIRSLSAHVWTGLYRLKYLDLSHNQLQNFSHLFFSSYLNELNQLKLSSNNISHLEPCEFLSLNSLTKLDLSEAHFSSFTLIQSGLVCRSEPIDRVRLLYVLRSQSFASSALAFERLRLVSSVSALRVCACDDSHRKQSVDLQLFVQLSSARSAIDRLHR